MRRSIKTAVAAVVAAGTVALAAQESTLNRANYRGPGPYEAERTSDTTLPNQTIYRPKDLSRLTSGRMPIVAWGNGGCAANGGGSAEPALMELAS